ncbi:MAG: alpha/beta hydrolase [Candidatus Obscuribacterales bacterium]
MTGDSELWRLRLLLFLLLADLLIVISPLNTFLGDQMMLFPVKETADVARARAVVEKRFNVRFRDASFSSADGKKLHGWYLELPGARKTYLFSHGNAGNISQRLLPIAALLESGGSVFIYDYQGFGRSEGRASFRSLVPDGLAAYDYLRDKLHADPAGIISYGESLGCAIATKIMEERPVAGVVLQSPFSSLVETARDKLPWTVLYPETLFPQRFLDNVHPYEKDHPPLLVLHGSRDSLLPERYAREIIAHALEPKRLELMPGTGHAFYLSDIAPTMAALRSFLHELPEQ